MSNININFKIDSTSSNYVYNGLSSLNRDIISFKDKDFEYYIDLGVIE